MLKLRRGLVTQVDPLNVGDAPVDEYTVSGAPATHMGRGLAQDRLFFAAALASGDALTAAALTELVS